MDYLYIIILATLFLFSIVGLVVGVSNDAVNFLNSGIGAKAASYKVLLVIALVGVMIGSFFSGGIMEIAQNGVFNPSQFTFHEVMMLFLAVMITNILLLDLFNTFGLPTSTTVALVFALLGAAFAISVMKVYDNGESMMMIGKYLNTTKAFAIIGAIFTSVAIAFTIGLVVMLIARLIFSFKYSRYYHFFGSLFGGVSIAIITYFIFIKGLHDVSFVPDYVMSYIMTHLSMIMVAIGAISFIILEILLFFVKYNVFKIVVFYGTFALALSFAGNDLVNFIGVPIAGYNSYTVFAESGASDATTFTMEALEQPAVAHWGFLLLAGLIMSVTLWVSKKAKSVVATTVNLSKQDDGAGEQFDSNQFARGLVKFCYSVGELFTFKKKGAVSRFVDKRFTPVPPAKDDAEPPAFDMLRAAVNLMVASTLIAFGTSLKLPLSTTYVAFMVAMGTSLADRAWGRESAVYRVSGVFTVIGGWFITAFIAFFVSAFFGFILLFGGIVSVSICIPLVAFILFRTNSLHKRKEEDEKEQKSLLESLNSEDFDLEKVSDDSIRLVVTTIPEIMHLTYDALKTEDIKTMKKAVKKVKKIDKQTLAYKSAIEVAVGSLDDSKLKSGEFYLKINENVRSIVVSLSFIVKPSYQHLNNLHKTLNEDQLLDLKLLKNNLLKLNQYVFDSISNAESVSSDLLEREYAEIQSIIDKLRVKQIQRIRSKETPSRSSLLFLNIISEFKMLNQFLLEMYGIEKQFKSLNND